MIFIIIFLVIPFIELALFASVSEHIGIFTTLSLAFLTAILGGLLVKHQGMQTILSMQSSMNKGGLPLNEIFDGFCLVAAGALLITPGFFTDAIGFALLVPTVRSLLRYTIKNHTQWSVESMAGSKQRNRHYGGQSSDIVDAEYEYVDEDHKEIRDERDAGS